MADRHHNYSVQVEWTGNTGTGTSGYRAYSRDHVISGPGKPDITGSSDPAFLGNNSRWNPEDLLVGSLSACHQLWYLHLCSAAGIVVLSYQDKADGVMVERERGHFTNVTLRPHVTIRAGDDAVLAEQLHHEAHEKCFIANSVNFPVRCEPVISQAGDPD